MSGTLCCVPVRICVNGRKSGTDGQKCRDLRNITRLAGTLSQELHKIRLLPFWFLRWCTAVGGRQFFKRLAFAFYTDFHVLARGFDVGMSEPVLDNCDVVAGLDQMKGRCMAKRRNSRTVFCIQRREPGPYREAYQTKQPAIESGQIAANKLAGELGGP